MKRAIFFLITLAIFSNILFAKPSQNDDMISNFKHFSHQQLLDTAKYYFDKNSADTALICYSLLINTPVKDADFEQQKRIIESLNNSAVIYHYMCDYRSAYELLIRALILCEKINYESYKSRIYNNIGNIYFPFNKYDMAKLYYSRSLNLCQDSTAIVVLLNNLGAIEGEKGKMDSAFYFFNKALQISKRHSNTYLYYVLNNLASLYTKTQCYDSAFYYARLSLDEAKKHNKIEVEANNLSNLGELFFKINQMDSALFYINLSNAIAEKNNFLKTLSENYLTLSKIEESKGYEKNALELYKKYADLRDSILNAKNFGDINQLQRLYEVSKTNQQIEQLYLEQQVKEQTIYYQRINQLITLCILLSVSVALLIIFFQKRKLNTAYKALFKKNIEIIELQESSPKKYLRKYKKSALADDMQGELLNRILILMEDTAIVCDTEFSVDKLAELLQSNQKYVSQVINTALKKNFRSFVNGYRIREAQRLFSDPDVSKYTIESIALRVGFKSRNAFREAFKEIIGVNPNFYLKSMREVES